MPQENNDQNNLNQNNLNQNNLNRNNLKFFVQTLLAPAGMAATSAVGYRVLENVIGQASIPLAAGSIGMVAASCAVGFSIMIIPTLLLNLALDKLVDKETHPWAHFALKTGLNVGLTCASIAIGAAMFGLAFNPILMCVVAGAITFGLAIAGVALLVKICSLCLSTTEKSSELPKTSVFN